MLSSWPRTQWIVWHTFIFGLGAFCAWLIDDLNIARIWLDFPHACAEYFSVLPPLVPILLGMTWAEWKLCEGQNPTRSRRYVLPLAGALIFTIPTAIYFALILSTALIEPAIEQHVGSRSIQAMMVVLTITIVAWMRALISLWMGVGPDRDIWLPSVALASILGALPFAWMLRDHTWARWDSELLLFAIPAAGLMGLIYGAVTSWIIGRASPRPRVSLRQKLGASA